VEPGEREQVARRGGDQARRADAARQSPEPDPGAPRPVPDRGPVQDRLLGQGDGLAQFERLTQPFPQRDVPRAAVEHLDDPAEQYPSAVAVGVGAARRERRGGSVEQADVALDAVVAAAGVGEDVTVDPARVGEQVRHRDLVREIRGAQPQAGQGLGHGHVQGQQSLLDQLHDHGGGPQLGDRPDLKQGIGADSHPGRAIEYPVGG
jgi:hypothetical protein